MSSSPCSNQDRLHARATVCGGDQQALELELLPARPCEGCQGLCLWAMNRRPTRLVLPRGANRVAPGDELLLSVPARAILHAALLAYGVPLLAMLGGALLLGLGGADGRAVLGALLGLAAGLPLGRLWQRRILADLVAQAAYRDGSP